MSYLRQHFAIETQLEAYATAILGAQRVAPPTTRSLPLGPETRYHLAPWCYQWGEGMIFHDYRARHESMSELCSLLAAYPGGFDSSQARAAGISEATITAWLQDGYIAPRVG